MVPAVDEAVGVRLEAVGYAFLPVRDDCLGSQQFAREAVVEQTSRWDGVEVAGSDGGKVECGPIGTQRDSVRAKRALTDGHGGSVGQRV